MKSTATKIKEKGVAACDNRNTDNESVRVGCSPQTQDKPQSEWIDLGRFEVQDGVLLFDIDQIPESIRSIVWLSRSKCREFQRRKLAKDVLPKSAYDERSA